MPAEPREMREAGDELVASGSHRFGPELICTGDGCGVTWFEHAANPEDCKFTPTATDRRPVTKEVRAAARRGETVPDIARRYQLSQKRVEEMISKEAR